MRDCLQSEPDERPSAKDLVNRLSGSASIARSISQRSTSWSNAGNTISGQTLADRCARAATCPLLAARPCCTQERSARAGTACKGIPFST